MLDLFQLVIWNNCNVENTEHYLGKTQIRNNVQYKIRPKAGLPTIFHVTRNSDSASTNSRS